MADDTLIKGNGVMPFFLPPAPGIVWHYQESSVQAPGDKTNAFLVIRNNSLVRNYCKAKP